jgi:hypothetical protein
MKIEINLPEVFSAATFGVIAGLLTRASTDKWHRLGRDAYLAHYGQIFDRQTAHTSNLAALIIVCIILSLVGLAVFKFLAFVYEAVSSILQKKRGTAEG